MNIAGASRMSAEGFYQNGDCLAILKWTDQVKDRYLKGEIIISLFEDHPILVEIRKPNLTIDDDQLV